MRRVPAYKAKRARMRQNAAEWAEKVRKISEHRDTVVLRKEDHASAWGYVEGMFESLAGHIAGIKVYKNDNTAFCKRMGISRAAGGIFIPSASTILVCYNNKIPDDVVLVHEMLHYCSQLIGSRFGNREAEEDFAYLNSLPYLASQGYDRDWMTNTYLLPYYWSCEEAKVRRDKGGKPLSRLELREAKKAAMEKCNSLVGKIL